MLRKLLDRPIAVTMVTIVLAILGIVSSRLLPAGKTRNGPAVQRLPAHIPILY